MKNTISLDLDHPSKNRTEYFLNAVEAALVPIPLDWRNWSHANDIVGGFKFTGKDQPITITVILADSYHDANKIATTNSFPRLPNAKWTVNGDVLYLVESPDEDRVSEVLSLFAGRE
jgi:hypothetical protein